MANRRCELTMRGPVPHTLLALIRTRFGRVSTVDDRTVLIVEDLDQASLRALLNLLWDNGHELLSLIPSAAATGNDRDRSSS
ncbi:hypothetical protein Val02_65170 [Virgisporangium aliadipatigenens]|uniref:Uncharacterized protein n=1 Tax=Virgisporangium aliadipatigenens TaxID=741659 RepID=A0A8J4DTT4_9ACTN|nr:hypothetical protein [Virgisporangium aliadipatigenens]GIJ49631.1 hypothetical protein Val02_65170 [Virgisporangium aliadipatigenens]